MECDAALTGGVLAVPRGVVPRGSASRRRRTQGDIRPPTSRQAVALDLEEACCSLWCALWGWAPTSSALAVRSRVSRLTARVPVRIPTYVRDPTITRVAFSLDAHTAVTVVFFGFWNPRPTPHSVNLWRVVGREAALGRIKSRRPLPSLFSDRHAAMHVTPYTYARPQSPAKPVSAARKGAFSKRSLEDSRPTRNPIRVACLACFAVLQESCPGGNNLGLGVWLRLGRRATPLPRQVRSGDLDGRDSSPRPYSAAPALRC